MVTQGFVLVEMMVLHEKAVLFPLHSTLLVFCCAEMALR